ncbi:MAG: PAS domain S-box protein [Acidimicrobiales bacterium]
MPKLRSSSPAEPRPPATDTGTSSGPVLAEWPDVDAAVVHLAQAMDSMLDPMVILRPVRDEHQRIVDFEYANANEAAARHFQLARRDLIGSRLRDLEQVKSSGLFDHHLHVYETGEPLVLNDFVFTNPVTGAPGHYDVRETMIGGVLSFTWRDVTERAELLDHYRLLAENASDVVFRVDAEFTIEWISPSVEDVQGFTPDEVIGRPLSEFGHPDDLPAVWRLIEETPDNAMGEIELRILSADGNYRWVLLNGRRFTDDDGRIQGYVGSLRDIDAEHARREVQLATDHRYRLLAENASDVVMVSHAGGDIQWVSSSLTALAGWQPEEMVGHRFADFVHDDDQALLDEWRVRIERGEVGRLTLRLRTAQGTYHWIAVLVRDVIDETTGQRQRVASWRDAEQEVVSRAALEDSEYHFRILAENASDVVWRTNADGVFEWVSPSVERVLGWRPEQLVGSAVEELVHPEDRDGLDGDRAKVLAGDVVHFRERRYRTAGGDYLWQSVHLGPIVDDDGTVVGVVAGLRDVSSLVESRESLARSETRFRLLAENASDVVVQLNQHGVFSWVSPSVEQVLGWHPDAVVGRSASEFFLAEDLDGLDAARSSDEAVRTGRLRVRQPDGTYLWMAARSKTTFADPATPSGRVIALRDVAAEVAARETLIASESRFRLLAENASDVVLETDGESRVRWTSPSVQRVLGWRPEQWTGHDPTEFVHPDDIDKLVAHRRAALRGERTPPLEVRFRDADGGYHWMSGEDHLVRGRGGEVVTRVIGLRGIDAEVAALESMAHAEGQFQMLAENASDIVLQIDQDSRITWVSPSVKQVLGWDPRDLIGGTSWHFLYEEDRERVVALRRLFFMGEAIDTFEIRAVTPTGDVRWLSMRPRAVRDEHGVITATVMSIRDIQSEVLARRAITTLSDGSRAVIRAQDESALLHEMCEVATDQGGYDFAWYARKVDDEERSILKAASSERNSAYLDEIEVTWNDGPQGQGPVGRSIRLGETVVTSDFRSDVRMAPWLEAAQRHGLRTAVALPVTVNGVIDGSLLVYASESDAFDAFAVSVLESLAGELGHGLNRLREQAQLLRALNDQKLLSSAIEQAAETVLIMDPSFTILYANPSTERTSGYALAEVIGQRPDMFGTGRTPQEYLDNITLTLARGESWRGTFYNRRKTGEIYEEDATISPVHDENGRLVAYVEVKSDLSRERRLESDLSRTLTDRSSFIEVMRSVRTASTVHATAYLFSEAAIQLPGVDLAALLLVQDEELLPISVSGSNFWNVDEERTLHAGAAALARFDTGPFAVTMDPADWPQNPQIAAALAAEGFVAVVYAPVRWGGATIGVLALATKSPEVADQMSTRFGYYEEIAAYAGTLIGAQAQYYERRSEVRAHVRDVMENRRFRPFFQPVIDLQSGAVVGYEALTRFDDGVRPDEKILEAHSVGLGSELEAALAAAALEEAARLPAGAFVSINFSPDTLLDGHAKQVLKAAGREIVIEITEHAPIDDYAAVRRAMKKLTGCVLAVDDAGAGYTSLNHILELRPRYVKLDISLVRNVDSNPARQAMVAGMCHFAHQSHTILVAEGVETDFEADTLRRLGVALGEGTLLGQGFLFGRPAPIE